MKKYYLIPLTEKDIYLNDKSLRSILDSLYPELLQREIDRINILYSVSPLIEMPTSVKQRYEQHNIETKKMYDEAQVPYYLIAYGNDRCAEEILTKSKITSRYPAALGIRSVSKEKAEEYYASSNYETAICRIFNNNDNSYKNSFDFTDDYEIEGYIDGIIENQNIKGFFKGKARIKRLIQK